MAELRSMVTDLAEVQDWNCWLRAADGPKEDYGYIKVDEDILLQFVMVHWGASNYFVSFREKGKPSPNSSPVISATHSPKQGTPPTRRKKGKSATVDPETVATAIAALQIAKPVNHIDPLSLEAVDKLGEDKIVLRDGDVVLAIDVEMLMNFVKSRCADGTALNEIVLTTEHGTVQLSTRVWVTSLLRNNRCKRIRLSFPAVDYNNRHNSIDSSEFLSLFIDMASHLQKHAEALKKLHTSPLFTKIKLFLKDLMTFGSDEDARQRLESDLSTQFYLSSAYFTPQDVQTLMDFPTGSGLTFKDTLEVLMKDKMDQTRSGVLRDYNLCTSHDLAPLIREVFGVRKGFQEEKGFVTAHKTFTKAWRKKEKA